MERLEIGVGNVIGHYTINKSLGEGAFGQVFRAVDGRNGSTVALKVLKLWCVSPDEREKVTRRFDMEYDTGRIDSPYLVHTLDRGIYHDNPFIVMEYCDGGDLWGVMQRGGVDMVRVSTQVLRGLSALHREGKVHRDLKPENVLIRHDGTAVLTDFGISGDRNNRMTRRGIMGTPKEIMGTFIYMPPEQVRPPSGNATVLPTTDIFSFGVMIYQMLTGKLPFGPLENDDDMERYCENGRNGRWDRAALGRVHDGEMWMKVEEGCLEPNFKRRLQNVDEVLRLLPTISDIPPEPIQSRHFNAPHGEWQIRVMQGEEPGRTYSLHLRPGQKVLCVGRQSSSANNDVPIIETQSSYISRAHCTLEWDEQEKCWYLWDGQWNDQEKVWKPSLNGTFVGSRQATIEEPVPLSPGDIIALGDATLRIEA